jgi:hypothetical protein
MFNFIRKSIKNWLNSYEPVLEKANKYKSIRVDDSLESSEGLRLRILPAQGGHVIEFRNYDSIKDRNNTVLHLITSDENFSERLAHIITMELLRNS